MTNFMQWIIIRYLSNPEEFDEITYTERISKELMTQALMGIVQPSELCMELQNAWAFGMRHIIADAYNPQRIIKWNYKTRELWDIYVLETGKNDPFEKVNYE